MFDRHFHTYHHYAPAPARRGVVEWSVVVATIAAAVLAALPYLGVQPATPAPAPPVVIVVRVGPATDGARAGAPGGEAVGREWAH